MPAKYFHRIDDVESYSHIYNRGVGKKVIFNDSIDYEVFLGYIKEYLTTPRDLESTKQAFTVNGRVFRGTPHQPKNYFNKIELIAYSLMPNHFHLVLRQSIKGSIENFMKSLSIRYSIYFNRKYKCSGTLFEGPYRSVQIKEKSSLPHLVLFLHNGSAYSSSLEYLGTRITPWVKPDKSFAEQKELNQIDKEILKGITLETEAQHLETNNVVINENIQTDTDLKPVLNPPQFLAVSTLMLILLVGLGVRNIMASSNNSLSSISIPTPLVLSEKSVIEEVKPTPTPVAEKVEPKIILVVIKITDGSEAVDIYKEPTINSERVSVAKEGDIFEFISENSDWYEVKLTDGSTGYVSVKYIEKIGEI